MLYRHMVALVLVGFAGPFAFLIMLAIQNDALEEQLKQPTYHCDGSETRGFAAPGTPEAAACWFEVKK